VQLYSRIKLTQLKSNNEARARSPNFSTLSSAQDYSASVGLRQLQCRTLVRYERPIGTKSAGSASSVLIRAFLMPHTVFYPPILGQKPNGKRRCVRLKNRLITGMASPSMTFDMLEARC